MSFNFDDLGDDGLPQYLAEIAQSKPLSSAREAELSALIKQGDLEARNELVGANLRFVVSVAKQYQNRGLPLSDLISSGNLGLLTAAERFDGTKGYKFISYAVWWIRQSILQAIGDQARTVRLPLNKIGFLREISKATLRLGQGSETEPDLEAIAAELGDVSLAEVEETILAGRAVRSLDAQFKDEEEDNLLARLADPSQPSPDATVISGDLQREIEVAFSCLDARERRIIREYFGLDGNDPLTLDQIGDRLGLTRERVRQIKERALGRLRHPSRSNRLRSLRDPNFQEPRWPSLTDSAPRDKKSGVSSHEHGEDWARMRQSLIFCRLDLEGPDDLKKRLQVSGGDVAALFRDKGLTGPGIGPTIQMVRRFAVAAGFYVKGSWMADGSGNSQPAVAPAEPPTAPEQRTVKLRIASPAQVDKILEVYHSLLKELGEPPTVEEVAYQSGETEELVRIVLQAEGLIT